MSQPLVISSMSSTPEYAGSELGTTQWLAIAQDRIALFGLATGDTRWIHLDPERAGRESPWKSTIADGYLLLSLVPSLHAGADRVCRAGPPRSTPASTAASSRAS